MFLTGVCKKKYSESREETYMIKVETIQNSPSDKDFTFIDSFLTFGQISIEF